VSSRLSAIYSLSEWFTLLLHLIFVLLYCICRSCVSCFFFFFSSRRRHTRSVSAFLLNRSSDLLGGFFMVRSYYPSECHADYFDFERIEALKPAIEACGISTLSQSPMLGFHKQMDNRIKLLEEILSFRMQGVEFDNG